MATTRTRIDITGIEELNKKAKQLNKDIFAILGEAVLAGADIVRDAAKAKARKKSGALASGIISTVTWDKKAPVAFAGAGMDRRMNDVFVKYDKKGNRFYYPSSIEYGHPRAPAYPFMRPAMDEKKAEVRKEIREKIKAVIERVGR